MAAKKSSPFKTGRRSLGKSGDGGLFLSIKEDETHTFAPLRGLDGMVSADMHEYWDIRPAIFHPCIGADCPGCQVGNEPRFKGYLPIVMQDGNTKIYAFTVSIYNQLEELEDMMEDETLAGKAIKVRRTGSGFKTRYNVIPTGKEIDVSGIEEPDFIKFIGPSTREEIVELLQENGLLEGESASTTAPKAEASAKASKWDMD